jgi:hypothetical protein
MKKYVYIYHVDAPVEMNSENMAAFTNWFGTLGDKLVDGGNPFNPKFQARISGGKVDMDADTASGYTIVEAENLEEAVTMAMSNPLAAAPGCSVKVYETMPM